jgi:hypothetical protein
MERGGSGDIEVGFRCAAVKWAHGWPSDVADDASAVGMLLAGRSRRGSASCFIAIEKFLLGLPV